MVYGWSSTATAVFYLFPCQRDAATGLTARVPRPRNIINRIPADNTAEIKPHLVKARFIIPIENIAEVCGPHAGPSPFPSSLLIKTATTACPLVNYPPNFTALRLAIFPDFHRFFFSVLHGSRRLDFSHATRRRCFEPTIHRFSFRNLW